MITKQFLFKEYVNKTTQGKKFTFMTLSQVYKIILHDLQQSVDQWFLNFFVCFTLLTKMIIRFTPNMQNGAYLLKKLEKQFTSVIINATDDLAFKQRVFQCLVK